MNLGLLAAIALASAPPAALPLRIADGPATAPVTPESPSGATSSTEPDPVPSEDEPSPPPDGPSTDDAAAPTDAEARPEGEPPETVDDATAPEPEPEPSPEPTPAQAQEPEPPAEPPTITPTTLPSPGDVEPGEAPIEDEPLPGEAYDPLRDSPEAVQARHWTRAGIALLAVGGALTIGAIVFGTVDPCTRGIGNSCQEAASRRAALTLGIPGAAMLVGGATSLAIGITRKNQLRASLAVSRAGALVGVSGRF